MRVCKHDCDVKMFCFSRANHASTNFWVQNSTSLLYLPIPSSAETWKIVTKKVCQFFFRLSWQFKREKSVFWIASFLQNKNWLRVQDFATGKNFSLNQRHNKQFCVFPRESYFIKAIENFFSCVSMAWYKHSRGWENSRQLCKPPRLGLGFA